VDIRIRAESVADVPAIRALTIQAFLRAPHTSHTEHLIVDHLRRAGQLSVSLVAEAAGSVIGHVGVSPVNISDGTRDWFGLGPLSVLPQHQRCGVGSQLVREALRRLRERAAAGCVLLGDPAFYGRFGFRADPALVLADVPPEYFLALPFDAAPARGSVVYHAAFAAPD
jgi:putative acetyltransferase